MKNIYFILPLLLLLSALSCRKDTVEYVAYSESLGEIDYFLSDIPASNTVTIFTLRSNGVTIPDTVLTTTLGTRVFLVDTDFLFQQENGSPQACKDCATLKIEVTEVADKSDWISRLLPATDADNFALQHTPAVRVRVTCDSKFLVLDPSRYLKIQTPSASLNSDMRIAYWAPGQDGTYTGWVAGENNAIYWAEWANSTQTGVTTGYEYLSRRLGWFSGIQRLGAPSYSKMCLSLPPQFDAENTRAYIVFEDRRSIIELLPDSDGRFCLEHTPLGYPVQVFTLSKAGPSWWFSNRITETATDDALLKMTPEIITEQELKTFILDL